MESAAESRPDGREGPAGPWLRALAAIGFLAAGAIHLGQVALHLTEGLVFAGFFLIVGVLQVVAAVALARARRPAWYWFGVVGSAATIGTWLVSRTFGLPFGAEPGSAETIGMADAAASLLEAVTIVALVGWLRTAKPGRTGSVAIGALLVAATGAVWFGGRTSGALDPDVRLTGFPPEFADRAVVVFVVSSVAILLGLVRVPAAGGGAVRRPLLRGLLVLAGLSAVALTALTLPARGGQNADCRYGPLAEVSGLSHANAPEPVGLAPGEPGDVAVLRLSVCGSEPLMITGVEPLGSSGARDTLIGFAVRNYVERIPLGLGDAGTDQLDPPTAELLDEGTGALLRPGETRELLARVRATAPGVFRLDSVRLGLEGPSGRATMTFATFLEVCTGPCPSGGD